MAKPVIVSHSQIGKLNRCEFLYSLEYEEKWTPKERAGALTFGSIIHDLAAFYYHTIKAGVGNIEHLLNQYVRENLLSSGEYDLNQVSQAATLFQRYALEYAPIEDQPWTPVEVEKHFEVEMVTPQGRPYILQMYVDLLMVQKSTGNIWLFEHKTVGGGKFWSEIQAMMDNQTATYQMALSKLGWNIQGIVYNQFNSYDYKKPPPLDKLFRRIKTYRTAPEIENMEREFGHSVDRRFELLENPDLPRRRNLNRDCSWCAFQEPCLMQLKGVPIESVLEPNFVRRDSYYEGKEQNEESEPTRRSL